MGSQINTTGLRTFTSSGAITQYTRVSINSSGYAVTAGADEVGIGIAEITCASGDPVTVRLHSAPGTRKITASAAISAGAICYCAASGQFGATPISTGPGLYRAVEAASGSGSIIEAIPAIEGGTNVVYANVADSTSVTNTTDETAFSLSKTIAGTELQVGDVIQVRVRTHCVSTNSTDTLNIKLKFGSVVIAATGAVDVANSDTGYIDAMAVIRTVGASGKVSASSTVALGVIGTVTAKPYRLDETTLDTSGTVAITVTATWSVASASNDVILEDLIVLKHRQ